MSLIWLIPLLPGLGAALNGLRDKFGAVCGIPLHRHKQVPPAGLPRIIADAFYIKARYVAAGLNIHAVQ